MSEIEVRLEVWRDYNGLLQVSIGQVDAKGVGHGYRILGPSFIGRSELLASRTLDERAAHEIRSYLDKVASA